MAKLKAPLFSFGASGKLGDALVFFPWKGLHVVRSHVVPVNPDTQLQRDQRGYMREIVAAIHVAQASAMHPFGAADVRGYRALAGVAPTPRTWFNELVKEGIDQYLANLEPWIACQADTVPGVDQIRLVIYCMAFGGNAVTAGHVWYGTSPTALVTAQVANPVANIVTADILGLVTGTKYYFQYRPTAHADFVGMRSGIYSDIAK